MSTRSRIAVRLPGGSFRSIYAHWDGYPDHNGRILREHYTDLHKVHKLIELGDLSRLAPNLGSKHNFEKPPKGSCNFYSRDRGEDTPPVTSITLKGLLSLTRGSGGEWLYVFSEGVWFVGEMASAYSTQALGELKHLADVIAALPAPTPQPVAI